jgi:hypothetical protein
LNGFEGCSPEGVRLKIRVGSKTRVSPREQSFTSIKNKRFFHLNGRKFACEGWEVSLMDEYIQKLDE